MNTSIIKKPSAWIPTALSLVVFGVMIVGILMNGAPARQADEGTGAHLFQIWLLFEVLAIIFFTLKWLPQKPKLAVWVILIQIAAMLLPMSIVYFFKL